MTTAADVAPCRLLQLALQRSIDDHAFGHERGLWFDEDAAAHALEFFPTHLRHWKGEWAGKPFDLSPWQVFCIREVFGWKREDGTRRYRMALIEIPRKNGKTTFAAGIGLYLEFADHEPGAEIYSTATTRDQARIVWRDAEKMVRASPLLSEYGRISQTAITVMESGSTFQPLSSEAGSLEGKNPHGNIVDELHAHKNREVWDVMDTAMGARRQPLTLAITTAGVYDPESIGFEVHTRGMQILEGMLDDDATFVFIAAAEPDDDWTDPAVWIGANPNYGVSVYPSYLEGQCSKAKASPAALNPFLRRHLNIWTSSISRWLDPIQWQACNAEAFPEDLLGLECFGGLDLASTLDIAAFVAAFPDPAGNLDVVCRFWIPAENVAERVRRDRVPYDVWIRDGWLIATPGNVIDYGWIRKEIGEFADKHDLLEIGVDRWNASQLLVWLDQDGIDTVATSMTMGTLSDATKALEGLVRSGKLAHGDNPILRWMAANTAVMEDSNGNMKPDKKAATEKIDGIVALILAIDRLNRHEPDFIDATGITVVG